MFFIFLIFFRSYFVKLFENPEFQNNIIRVINECVDIPMLDENTEHQVYTAIFEIIKNAVLLK